MDKSIFSNSRLLLALAVTVLLLLFISCKKNKENFTIKFNVIDENKEPLKDVFITGYRLVDVKSEKKETIIEKNKFGHEEVDCVVPSLNIQTLKNHSEYNLFFAKIIKDYRIVNLKKSFDRFFDVSKDYNFYYNYEKLKSVESHWEEIYSYLYKSTWKLSVPKTLKMELLEQVSNKSEHKMVAYEVPIKYYLVFRKPGYDVHSIVVGVKDNNQTITVQLRKQSSNPHLETISETIRSIAKKRWTTSSSSEKKLKQLVLKLQEEQEYAGKNGYLEDSIALRQYIFSIPIDNVRYVIVGEKRPQNNEELLGYLSIAESILEQNNIDISYFDTLIRKIAIECRNNIPYSVGSSIELRLHNILIKYYQYLEVNQIIFPIFPGYHCTLVKKLCNDYNNTGCKTQNLLGFLNKISKQSLEVNPFQREGWEAYEMSLEK